MLCSAEVWIYNKEPFPKVIGKQAISHAWLGRIRERKELCISHSFKNETKSAQMMVKTISRTYELEVCPCFSHALPRLALAIAIQHIVGLHYKCSLILVDINLTLCYLSLFWRDLRSTNMQCLRLQQSQQ